MTFDDMMDELRQEYVASLPSKILTIEEHFAAQDIPELQNDFHKLKGTGKTYGLPEVSELGMAMENICKTKPDQLAESFPLAIKLLKRIYDERLSGKAVDLSTQPEFSSIRA